MRERTIEIAAIFGSIAAACWITAILAGTAQAGNNETEARWAGAGPGANWATVEVSKPGRGVDVRRLKAEREATFQIRVDGTGPAVTRVLIDGEEGELSAIPDGKIVHVHWRPVEGSEYAMFATKIVYLTDEAIAVRKKAAKAAEATE